MDILINVNDITEGQRKRIINLLDATLHSQNIEITEHPERSDWLVVECHTGQIEIDDVGCLREITYGDWSAPA